MRKRIHAFRARADAGVAESTCQMQCEHNHMQGDNKQRAQANQQQHHFCPSVAHCYVVHRLHGTFLAHSLTITIYVTSVCVVVADSYANVHAHIGMIKLHIGTVRCGDVEGGSRWLLAKRTRTTYANDMLTLERCKLRRQRSSPYPI